MNSFLKIFLATLAALVVFTIVMFFITLGFVSGLGTPQKRKYRGQCRITDRSGATFP